MEGDSACVLVEFNDRVVHIVDSGMFCRAVMPGRPDEAVNSIETADGRVMELPRRMR